MASKSKRFNAIREKIESGKVYSAEEGFQLLKDCSKVKFDETADVSIKLGVDPRKSDQVVRGAIVLPNGTGKDVRVAVFAQGPQAEAAKEAGAEIVGFDDLAETIKKGEINFDVLIATPDAMRLVGQLGQILGPRGLMPNPKVGTVSADAAAAVKNAKAGQARFRTDKAGIIHVGIGKLSFSPQQLSENLSALIAELKRLKPSAAKGVYLSKISISSTMGPGVVIDAASL